MGKGELSAIDQGVLRLALSLSSSSTLILSAAQRVGQGLPVVVIVRFLPASKMMIFF
jgi:hypothetical protein